MVYYTGQTCGNVELEIQWGLSWHHILDHCAACTEDRRNNRQFKSQYKKLFLGHVFKVILSYDRLCG